MRCFGILLAFSTLQFNIPIDEVVGENVTLLEKIPVAVKCIQSLVKALAHLRDFSQLILRQRKQISLQWYPGVDLVLYSIQSGQQEDGVCQVGIGRGVREPHLDMTGFLAGCKGNPERSGAVMTSID